MSEIVKSYAGWSFDDIVFDNRNKEYGAYQLRKLSPKNSAIGLIAAVSFTLLFIIGTFIDWSFLGNKEEEFVETTVTLAEPPP